MSSCAKRRQQPSAAAEIMGHGSELHLSSRLCQPELAHPSAEHDVACIVLSRDSLEQHAIQLQADQEAPEGGALRSWLVSADAVEPTKAGPTVQHFGSILALLESDIDRAKRMIGDVLRLHTDRRSGKEIVLADGALNRMLQLGRPGASTDVTSNVGRCFKPVLRDMQHVRSCSHAHGYQWSRANLQDAWVASIMPSLRSTSTSRRRRLEE